VLHVEQVLSSYMYHTSIYSTYSPRHDRIVLECGLTGSYGFYVVLQVVEPVLANTFRCTRSTGTWYSYIYEHLQYLSYLKLQRTPLFSKTYIATSHMIKTMTLTFWTRVSRNLLVVKRNRYLEIHEAPIFDIRTFELFQ
jgi:hypothetical protein